jgi:hypothetical protein
MCKPVNFTKQGYGFVPKYVKGEKGKYQVVVSEKSWKSMYMRPALKCPAEIWDEGEERCSQRYFGV